MHERVKVSLNQNSYLIKVDFPFKNINVVTDVNWE